MTQEDILNNNTIRQQHMPTNNTQSNNTTPISPVMNRPKISFSSIVATGTQSSSPTSPTNGSTRIESQIVSQRTPSQEQAGDNDPSNRKPLKKFTSTAAAAATNRLPPRRNQQQKTYSTSSEMTNADDMNIRDPSFIKTGDALHPQTPSTSSSDMIKQSYAHPNPLSKSESDFKGDGSTEERDKSTSKNEQMETVGPSKHAPVSESTSQHPTQEQHPTRRYYSTGSHSTQYLNMPPPQFPYMMGYPPMMPHGLYVPFPPVPPPFYGHIPPPGDAHVEGAKGTDNVGHPPGIGSPAKTPFVAPPPRRAIKIINPDTRQEVIVEKVATPSTLIKGHSVTLKTPSGQDVDIIPSRKDISSVASLESQLASLVISEDQSKEQKFKHIERGQRESIEMDIEEGEVISESEEEEEAGNYLIQIGQTIEYPSDKVIPFTPPSAQDEPWIYSRAFLLQFQSRCNAKNQEVRNMMLLRFKQAADRHRDRASKASSRTGRKHHTSQAHPAFYQPELQHRTENAWTPMSSSEVTDSTEKIVREVRGILNKLTLEKFDALSDKILSMGIMASSETLNGVINCVFDKAVDEPHFCPMYAQLCVKIVHAEAQERRKAQLEKGLPAPEKPYSEFRSLLVTRCQTEYLNKRAWSKKRLEKLFEKSVKDGTTLEMDQSKKPEDIGHLTEEDLSLIKTKRHVLGNVHFIGELFKTGLLSNRVMHDCVQELLANVENPEEEEIESLCRLLKTVGKLIDTPDAVEIWKNYIGRMKQLTQPNSPLTSRVRFMIMDVLELREQGWPISSKNAPKTLDELKREQERAASESRECDRRPPRDRANIPSKHVSGGAYQGDFYRGSSEGYGKREDSSQTEQQRSSRLARQDRADDSLSWHTIQSGAQPRASTPVKQFSTQAASGSLKEQSQVKDTWNTGSTTKKQILSRTASTTSFANTSTSALTVNRFDALEQDETEKVPVIVKTDMELALDTDLNIKDRLRKLIAFADEYFKISNIDDLLTECNSIPPPHHSEMLVKLIGHAMEMGRKEVMLLKPVLLALKVSPDAIQSAIQETFSMIDDLTVDIPAATEYAGFLLAVLAQITGTVNYEIVLSKDLQERSSITFLKTAVWTFLFLPPNIQRPQELIQIVFSIIDTTPSAIDVLKRSLKDSLYKALPDLELRAFDTALTELQSKQSSLSIDDFYFSLRHLLEPAIKLNPTHLSLILTRTSALVFDFMLSKDDTNQASYFYAALELLGPIDLVTSITILNTLAHRASQNLAFFEAVFKSFYNHQIISMEACLAWREENSTPSNESIIKIVSPWIDQLSDMDIDSTSAEQL